MCLHKSEARIRLALFFGNYPMSQSSDIAAAASHKDKTQTIGEAVSTLVSKVMCSDSVQGCIIHWGWRREPPPPITVQILLLTSHSYIFSFLPCPPEHRSLTVQPSQSE